MDHDHPPGTTSDAAVLMSASTVVVAINAQLLRRLETASHGPTA